MDNPTAKPATDLRTRIITAMLSEDDVALMADAVIRELGSDMSRLRNSSMTLPTDALRREIGTSVYEGVAEDIETPIIRTGGPLVTEDVEDGFAR